MLDELLLITSQCPNVLMCFTPRKHSLLRTRSSYFLEKEICLAHCGSAAKRSESDLFFLPLKDCAKTPQTKTSHVEIRTVITYLAIPSSALDDNVLSPATKALAARVMEWCAS